MWKKIKERYKEFIVPMTCIAFYVILNFLAKEYSTIGSGLSYVIGLVSPFLVGFGISFLWVKPVDFIEKLLLKVIAKPKLVRVLSVVSVLLLTLLFLIGIVILIIPQLIDSFEKLKPLILELSSTLTQTNSWLKSYINFDLESYLNTRNYHEIFTNTNPIEITKIVLSYSMSFAKTLINILISLICAMYLLIDKERFLRYMKKFNYSLFNKEQADDNVKIVALAKNIFNNFILGKALDSFIIGIICYFGMLIFGFEYAVLISFLVGITNMIPVFGPFIGGLPGVMILFISSPAQGLWFALFILVLQQFDGNILGPYILGDKLGLPSLGILIAVVIGGGLFGFLGMLLGVPVFALFYEIGKYRIHKKLHEKNIKID